MCLEAYSQDGPITIPYEHEFVLFQTPTKISGNYTFLVRNAGAQPLSSILLLYPKPLFELVQNARIKLTGVTNMLGEFERRVWEEKKGFIPGHFDGKYFEATLYNPNRPQEMLPNTKGLLNSKNVAVSSVAKFLSYHADLVTLHKFAAMEVSFADPLQPGESQWLSFRITFEDNGHTLVDGRTLQELAAPLRVRNTFVALFESAIADLNMNLDSENLKAVDDWWNNTKSYEEVLSLLGLTSKSQRSVDIEFHHLCLAASPNSCVIDTIDKEGDVVALANTPRRRGITISNERVEADVYEFKSGSLIRPGGNGSSFLIKVFLRSNVNS